MVELTIGVNAIEVGLLIVAARPPGSDLIFSRGLGCGLVLCGILMLLGMMSSWPALKVISSLSMLGVRLYMAGMRFQLEWRDPAWISHLTAAIFCGWIFQRVLCHERTRWEVARLRQRRSDDPICSGASGQAVEAAHE